MDTENWKEEVARHFDHAPHGTGLYFAGDWFTPKHKDSLEFLIDDITRETDKEISDLKSQLDDAETELEDLKFKEADAETIPATVL